MIVERIWTANAYRNYNYLIACPETGEALAIDPLDHEKCLATAKARGWDITQILNTHEHHDHTGGNAAVVAATGAKVIAHHLSGSRIEGVDRGVQAGDVIKVGKTVELECLDTPGHTLCHICLRSHTDQPALFSGDTLFNAGAGNVHNGGNVESLYSTFVDQAGQAAGPHPHLPRPRLPREQPALHPGARARQRGRPGPPPRRPRPRTRPARRSPTMAEEKEFNTFLRLSSPSVIAALREKFPELPAQPDPKTVFTRLRELRNSW